MRHGSRGRFGYRCVAGAYDVDPRDVARDEPVLGLPLSNTFVYGTVRDGQGTMFLPMRRIKGGDGGDERFLLQSSLEADAIHILPASRRSARSTGVERSWDDDGRARLRSAPDAEGDPFGITVTADSFTWREGDTASLGGRLVEPGLHWHLPDAVGGMYYVSRLFEVEGTVLGREVAGFVAVDDLYMHGTVYVDDILVGEAAEIVWYTWATRYEDEAAHRGPSQLVLTARAENHIHGRDDLADTINRLQAYQAAGADVLFAPGVSSLDDIRAVVSSVDRPVNVLAVPGAPSVAELASVGVARISVGGAFAFAALGGLVDAATELRDLGTYSYLERAARARRAVRDVFTS